MQQPVKRAATLAGILKRATRDDDTIATSKHRHPSLHPNAAASATKHLSRRGATSVR